MNISITLKAVITAMLLAVALSLSPTASFADTDTVLPCDSNVGPCQPSANTGPSGTTVTLENPLGKGNDDPRVIIGNIIKTVLGIVGSIALLLFIYGGLMMMTSAGNSDRVTKGRNTLVWATIGLLVIFGSYTIVAYLLLKIVQK